MVRRCLKLFVAVDLQLAIDDSGRMLIVVTYHFLNCHNYVGDKFRALLNLYPAKKRQISISNHGSTMCMDEDS